RDRPVKRLGFSLEVLFGVSPLFRLAGFDHLSVRTRPIPLRFFPLFLLLVVLPPRDGVLLIGNGGPRRLGSFQPVSNLLVLRLEVLKGLARFGALGLE